MCSELLKDVHAAWFRCIDGPIASMFSCRGTQGATAIRRMRESNARLVEAAAVNVPSA
jgi:hypothetical protein